MWNDDTGGTTTAMAEQLHLRYKPRRLIAVYYIRHKPRLKLPHSLRSIRFAPVNVEQ